jgi:MFS family permease
MDSPVSALAPFRQPGYSALAASNAISKFGWSVSIVALVWLVRGDPGAIGLIFALRAGAGLIFGIPAGLLADRVDRRTLLIVTDVVAIAVALVTAAAAAAGPLPQWGILLVAFLFGTIDSFKIASAQAYTYDLVGPLLATSGIAIAAIGIKLMSAFGNLAAGPVMDDYGAAVAFLVVAATSVASAAFLLLGAPSAEVRRRRAEAAPEGPPLTVRGSLVLVRRNHVLALLALAVIVTEIFGFSFLVLIPVFADEVFRTDAAGYGLMGAISGLGGAAALVVVAIYGIRLTRGSVLLTASGVFGASLIALAFSPTLAIALVPIFIVGGMAAVSDSLSQSLMQHSTLDSERGAAMGVWTFGIGCGPIGSLAVGIAAASIGAPITQAVSGAVLLVLAIALSFNRALRTLR